jgi:hypothetical protein
MLLGLEQNYPVFSVKWFVFIVKPHCEYLFLSYFVTFKRVLHDHDLIYYL